MCDGGILCDQRVPVISVLCVFCVMFEFCVTGASQMVWVLCVWCHDCVRYFLRSVCLLSLLEFCVTSVSCIQCDCGVLFDWCVCSGCFLCLVCLMPDLCDQCVTNVSVSCVFGVFTNSWVW